MTGTGRAATLRHLAPVWGLLVLAPWVGEYLLGNISIRELDALPFLVPLYGCGALLIREVARRTGRGWPLVLTLGAAYGVIEAGLVDQSLFNPGFDGWEFQAITPVPALGISAWHALAFIVGHTVWSIGAPIALVELLTPTRRTTPWLGKVGLTITAACYLLGCLLVHWLVQLTERFTATPGQLLGAAAAALALIALAFVTPRGTIARRAGAVPPPWLLGTGMFVAAGVYAARPENWPGFALGIALLLAAYLAVAHWSRQASWGIMHQLALVAAAFLTYAWLGFVITALMTPDDALRWGGNVACTLVAIGLLLWAARTVRAARWPRQREPTEVMAS